MSYDRFPVNLTAHQKRQLRKAIETNTPVKIRLSLSQLTSGDGIPLLLTQAQINKVNKSIQNNKGMMLSMSKTQIRENKKNGGFLPALIPIAIAIGTALATGAASAVGTYAVNKVIKAVDKGAGLYPQGTYGEGFTKIPGTDLVVRGNGLFPHGVKP